MSKKEFPWLTVRRQGLVAATGLSEEYVRTDLQRVQKQISDLANGTQKQINDLATDNQKQLNDLTQDVRVGFADMEGDIRELRSELKALDTKFEEKPKTLDQRITSKEFAGREILIGLTVTVVGGILLDFFEILFFGKVI
jgi:septal ring factor EnvC (AmiA/AmiB activator)